MGQSAAADFGGRAYAAMIANARSLLPQLRAQHSELNFMSRTFGRPDSRGSGPRPARQHPPTRFRYLRILGIAPPGAAADERGALLSSISTKCIFSAGMERSMS